MLRTYPDEIYRDTNVVGHYNVYLGNGQGCGTIWYKSVASARRAKFASNCIISGRDLVDCRCCTCHYAPNAAPITAKEFLCREAKRRYAAIFE